MEDNVQFRIPSLNLTSDEQDEFEKILAQQRKIQEDKIILTEQARIKRKMAGAKTKKLAVEALSAIAYASRHIKANSKRRTKFDLVRPIIESWVTVCEDPERYRTASELSKELAEIIAEFFPDFPYNFNAAGLGAHIASLREYYEDNLGMKVTIRRSKRAHRDHYLYSFAPVAQRKEQLPSKQ